jgi:hypothetical protein
MQIAPAALPSRRSTFIGDGFAIAVDGTPKAFDVVRDPGHRFAPAVRGCVFGKRWEAALDPEGRPVEAKILLNVRVDDDRRSPIIAHEGFGFLARIWAGCRQSRD